MSEDTAQGPESELQNARVFPILFQIRIHSRFEFMMDFVRGVPAGRRIPKSTWGADIIDRMNRMDRMTQTNIQILSIL